MSFREKSAWVTLVTLIVLTIEIVAHVAIAVWSPRDARAPKDERERLIELKSTAVAAYVYAILSLGTVFVTIHLGANEIALAYLILFCFVLAEIVNYTVRVILYRRGS